MKKPRQPKAPRKPSKPQKPQKRLQVRRNVYVDGLERNNGLSLKEFVDKIPDDLSENDVFLYMSEDYDECYSYSCCGGCSRSSSSLEVYYMEEYDNPNYKRQFASYEKKMTRYNNKLEEFNEKLKAYETAQAVYLKELQLWEAENTSKTIKKLERELKRLKAS
jgi:hypothetical protein